MAASFNYALYLTFAYTLNNPNKVIIEKIGEIMTSREVDHKI